MATKLKRTTQCAKCPWKVSTNPNEIPNGYDVEKHKRLEGTIARGNPLEQIAAGRMRVMACHESHDAHCIGWLMNQLGPGNNIALRITMRNCENLCDVKLVGEQHERFEDTVPECPVT